MKLPKTNDNANNENLHRQLQYQYHRNKYVIVSKEIRSQQF
jgi:hypothetical protein